MSKTIERANEYRLPIRTTPEILDMRRYITLDFENPDGQKRILLAGYYYTPGGGSWFAAVYEYTYDNETSCTDSIGIREVSEKRFSTNGNAIEWAIKNA